MNTSQIKAYAPKARIDFIQAVTERAARFGIHENHIDPILFEGDVAIIGDQALTRTEGEQRKKLAHWVKQSGFEMFIRSSAYTWFNRFVAIRYMELHDFLDHGYRVLSNFNKKAHIDSEDDVNMFIEVVKSELLKAIEGNYKVRIQ